MTDHYRSLVAVYAVVINEQQEILLLRRANTGYRDGYYDMPAGHLEDGETLTEAAVRELREESGLHATADNVKFVQLLHRFCSDRVYIDVFFRVTQWTNTPSIQEPEKCDDMQWFPLATLPEMIVPHQRSFLTNLSSHNSYREIREEITLP